MFLHLLWVPLGLLHPVYRLHLLPLERQYLLDLPGQLPHYLR